MHVGAAPRPLLRGVDDGAPAAFEHEANELSLGRPRPAAGARADREVGRDYSSVPAVGSADSGRGSSDESLVATTPASSASSSSSSPVRAVTSSVSKSTSAWWAGRPQ